MLLYKYAECKGESIAMMARAYATSVWGRGRKGGAPGAAVRVRTAAPGVFGQTWVWLASTMMMSVAAMLLTPEAMVVVPPAVSPLLS